MVVTDLLVEHFPKIMDLKFTAHMEDELDEIATAKEDMVKVLDEFYDPFQEALKAAETKMERVQVAVDGGLPRLRRADGGEVQQDRPVPRLLEVSRVQGDPADGRPAPRRGRRDRAHAAPSAASRDAPREQARASSCRARATPSARSRSTSTRRATRSRRWSRPSTSARSAASRWRCGRARAGRSWAAPATPSAGTRWPSTTRASRSQPVKVDVKCEKCGGPMGVKQGPPGRLPRLPDYPKCRSTAPIPDDLKEKLGELPPAAAGRRPGPT